MPKPLCAICGVRDGITKDHIPPRSIFVKPYPNNLITVPACPACNNGSNQYDEIFAAMLGLHVARGEQQAQRRMFNERALKILGKNQRLARDTLKTARPVEIRTPSGVIVEQASAILWDSRSHDEVITRIVRGLYYRHYGEILGARAVVKPYWFRELGPKLRAVAAGLNTVTIGDVFTYHYGRTEKSPLCSAWLFEFYQGHWAGGFTTPVEASIGQVAEMGD